MAEGDPEFEMEQVETKRNFTTIPSIEESGIKPDDMDEGYLTNKHGTSSPHLTPLDTRQYACTKCTSFANSLFLFLMNSFLLTGSGSNSPATATVVPGRDRASDRRETMAPSRSYSRAEASASEAVRVDTESEEERAHSEESASPRKPKEDTEDTSEKERILDVWCFRAAKKRLRICSSSQTVGHLDY